jgi:hypothetical protein
MDGSSAAVADAPLVSSVWISAIAAGDGAHPGSKGYEAIAGLLLDDGGLLAWLIDRAREGWTGSGGAGRLARGEVFLVLAALASNLDGDVDDDDVDHHADSAECGDQADGLDERLAGSDNHAREPTNAPGAGCRSLHLAAGAERTVAVCQERCQSG